MSINSFFNDKRVGVKAAIITGIFTLIAAFIAGIFLIFSTLVNSNEKDIISDIKKSYDLINSLDALDKKIQYLNKKITQNISKIHHVGNEVEIEIGLAPGWNMISFPVYPIYPEKIIIDSQDRVIFRSFNSGTWNDPYMDTVNLNIKQGYAVYLCEYSNLKLKGNVPPLVNSIYLKKGINLVGYPSLIEKSVNEAFNEIRHSVLYVLHRRNNESQVAILTKNKKIKKEILKKHLSYENKIITLDKLRPCRSYFVYVDKDVIWQILN